MYIFFPISPISTNILLSSSCSLAVREKFLQKLLLARWGVQVCWPIINANQKNQRFSGQGGESVQDDRAGRGLRRGLCYAWIEDSSTCYLLSAVVKVENTPPTPGTKHRTCCCELNTIKVRTDATYFVRRARYRTKLGWFFWFVTIQRYNTTKENCQILVRRTRYRTKLAGSYGSARYTVSIRPYLGRPAEERLSECQNEQLPEDSH